MAAETQPERVVPDRTLLDPRGAEALAGFKSMFNGKDLNPEDKFQAWEGLTQFWSVKDGAITGQTTSDNPAKGNTFLVWKGGDVGDFEFRSTYRIVANNTVGFANSGIQYRSKLVDPSYFVVGGYQADMEAGKTYSGILYEERGRGILANRAEKVVIHADPGQPKIEVVGKLGDSADIQAQIKPNDWNEYVIVAKGNHLQHFINGRQTIDVVDEQSSKVAKSGILALQLHAGQPMTVQFKNLRIKMQAAAASAQSEIERVQGNWVASELIENGEGAPSDVLSKLKLKINGNRFSLEHPDGVYEGKFEIKDSGTPRKMDITLDDGSEAPALYEFSNETIRVCYAQPGGTRPSAFRSSAGSDLTVAIYKRPNP
jgi:uncharacterized protein (TIGR03067 family)